MNEVIIIGVDLAKERVSGPRGSSGRYRDFPEEAVAAAISKVHD